MMHIILAVCYAIGGLVLTLVLYACFRFREKPGRGEPPKQFGIRWMERSWTLLPLLLLVAMFSLTAVTIRNVDPPAPRHDVDLVVTGHQFWWEFGYPKSGAVTSYELHLPVGRNLATRVNSVDVIHDFSVMQLGRKMDALPDYWNYMWFGASQPGIFQGFCHEFCGEEHSWMLFKVVAEPEGRFQAWLRHEAEPAQSPAGGVQERGYDIFMGRTCVNCHRIRGTKADGVLGPDLTHFALRDKIGSGILDNNSQNLYRWLKNPPAIKPGVRMPNLQLNDPDTSALVAYLDSLR